MPLRAHYEHLGLYKLISFSLTPPREQGKTDVQGYQCSAKKTPEQKPNRFSRDRIRGGVEDSAEAVYRGRSPNVFLTAPVQENGGPDRGADRTGSGGNPLNLVKYSSEYDSRLPQP